MVSWLALLYGPWGSTNSPLSAFNEPFQKKHSINHLFTVHRFAFERVWDSMGHLATETD